MSNCFSIALERWRHIPGVTLTVVAVIAGSAPSATSQDPKLEAYGRHLARECTSCHRIDGVNNGIPSIIGLPPDTFVTTMKFYREGARTNPVMVSVANSLTDEQLQALAAFFASVPQPTRNTAPGEKGVKK
jgi:cytochrome c553